MYECLTFEEKKTPQHSTHQTQNSRIALANTNSHNWSHRIRVVNLGRTSITHTHTHTFSIDLFIHLIRFT